MVGYCSIYNILCDKMNVLIVIRAEMRFDHAPSSRVYYIAKTLKKFDISSTLLGIKSESNDAIVESNGVIPLFNNVIGNILLRIQLPFAVLRILQTKKIDYIILRNYDLIILFISTILNKRIFYDFHGYRYKEQQLESRFSRSKITMIQEKLMQRYSYKIIAISDEIYQQLPKKYHNKTLILPNGVDLNLFKTVTEKEKVEIKRKYKIPENKKIVGIVGNLGSIHDTDTFMKSIKFLPKNVCLVAVGMKYPMKVSFDQDSRLIRTGQLKHRDAIQLIYIMDICVAPYKIGGISSRKIREYLAAGKPIITTDVPGREKIFENGKHILLYKLGDPLDLANKVKMLLNNEKLYNQMCENNLKLSKRFSWENMVKKSTLLDFLIK